MNDQTQNTVSRDAGKEKDFSGRTEAILKRLHRADKRDTGMRLTVQDVADLAYYLSNQIAGVIEEQGKGNLS